MTEPEEKEDHGLADSVSGLGQKIIGEIEFIGGALTGDPITVAEGEYNAEVGDVREDLEDEGLDTESGRRGDAETE
ncbi:MAG: hypothetical protein DMF63_07110 [Acidobacteria bacterium]|nr:MAG: hypothetical protein DMF63_07110 [Acidobacteriota bacterium]